MVQASPPSRRSQPPGVGLASGWDRDGALVALAALALLALALFDRRLLNDGDTYWHLAAGSWMLSHGQVPHTDPFTYTLAGAPWHAHEWLSEVLMAAAFRLWGWGGLVGLYGLSLAATALLLGGQLRRSLSGLSLGVALLLALACAAPNLLARPHVLVLPVAVAWISQLIRAREAGRAPPLWAAGLMLAWANLHGSFVFGFLLAGAFGLEALIAASPGERVQPVLAWGGFGLASLAAAAITPFGPAGLIFPFQLMGLHALAGVEEWRPMDFAKPGPFELALMATLFVGFSRGVKVAPLRLLVLIGLLHMALQHNRHAMIVALSAALILAEPMARALGQPPPPKAAGRAVTLGFLLIAAALFAGRAAVPLTRGDGPTTPGAAVDHVPAALRARPVLNEYGLGGYLIFRGVRPYVDGRTDMFGDAFMDDYYRLASPDAGRLDQVLKQRDIAWTLLPPTHPLVALMDARPGWRRLYADRYAVVHARVDGTGRSP